MNSYIFVSVEIYKFKVKDSEINVVPLFLGIFKKYFWVDNMKNISLHEYGYVDYDNIDVDDILNI